MTAACSPRTRSPYRDQSARQTEQMVLDHVELVRRLAWHVAGKAHPGIELSDLVQAGMVALVEAARNYEDMGFSFSTYATTRVRGAMIDHLRRQATASRSARTFRKAADQARSRLEHALGRSPSDHEMAAALGMAPEEYRQSVSDALEIRLESIDDAYSDSIAAFAADDEPAEERLDRESMGAALRAALAQMPEREAMILQLYFLEELNLHEIGAVLGVGAARVCQIKKAAMNRLRNLMNSGSRAAA